MFAFECRGPWTLFTSAEEIRDEQIPLFTATNRTDPPPFPSLSPSSLFYIVLPPPGPRSKPSPVCSGHCMGRALTRTQERRPGRGLAEGRVGCLFSHFAVR